MLIGEISNKTGLSRDTIRYYEKRGLLEVERTSSEFNDYKNYTSEHLNRLELIKKAKRFGFTINEIAELLDLFDMKSANCSVLQNKVNLKLKGIDKRIQELKELRLMIVSELEKAQVSCASHEDDNCELIK